MDKQDYLLALAIKILKEKQVTLDTSELMGLKGCIGEIVQENYKALNSKIDNLENLIKSNNDNLQEKKDAKEKELDELKKLFETKL